jgi:hypothetical protein
VTSVLIIYPFNTFAFHIEHPEDSEWIGELLGFDEEHFRRMGSGGRNPEEGGLLTC